MPTPYTGDPTAPQAPSPAPEPDNLPIANIPIATEGRTVSSIEQFVKAAFDQIAWLKRPRAKASAWEQAVQLWRSSQLHKRFAIDHFGLPSGRLQNVREDFAAALSAGAISFPSGNMTASKVFGEITVSANQVLAPYALPGWRYRYTAAGAGPASVLSVSLVARNESAAVRMEAADTAGDHVIMNRAPTTTFHPDVAVSAEWDAKLETHGNVAATAFAGIGAKLFGSDASPSSNGQPGLYFFRAGGNWFARVNSGSGTTDVDTTVAADSSWHRFKVVWVGANVSDDATARALFFLDGTLRANITTNLPPFIGGVGQPAGFWAGTERTGGGAVSAFLVAALNLANNTWQDAI